MIYLDNNATTKPCDEAARAVDRACAECWANPSSMHRAGQEARREVELARADVARLVGVKPREVVFTSGATEASHLAIRGVLGACGIEKPAVVISAIEHESIRDLCAQLERSGAAEIRRAPVGRGGVVDVAALEGLMDERVAIVSVMWANNETGVVQPVGRIGELCRGKGVVFHSDATQWIGRMPADLSSMPIDLASCSAHKFHGLKGAGALIARRGVRLSPTQPGVHELGRRGGTENVPGILAMGAAARSAVEWLADAAHVARGAALRDAFERAVLARCAGAAVNGAGERLWTTTNIAFPGVEAEALLMKLSERGVCASAGAACSSGSLDASPVLLAMGVPDGAAHGSLRFSLSRWTTADEAERGAAVVAECAAALRGSTARAV